MKISKILFALESYLDAQHTIICNALARNKQEILEGFRDNA